MSLSIAQQDTNVPEGGVELDENGQEIQLSAEQQKLVELGRSVRTNDDDSTPVHTKPEGVPEKFWDSKTGQVNYEAMAKSYVELEAKLGGKKPDDTTAQTKQKTPGAEGEQETPEQQQQEQDNAFTKASKEFAEKGAITEDTYKVLAEKHNIPKEYVDAFVEGQVAKQQLQQQTSSQKEEQLLGSIGGREAFSTMSAWAAQSFSESELKAFNDQVALSAESAALALQFLKTRYEQANGKEAKLLLGGRTAPQVSDGFASKSDMMAAMRDPRYGTDQVFTAEVARKMANRRFTF